MNSSLPPGSGPVARFRRTCLLNAIRQRHGLITVAMAAQLNGDAGFSGHRNTARKDLRSFSRDGFLKPLRATGNRAYCLSQPQPEAGAVLTALQRDAVAALAAGSNGPQACADLGIDDATLDVALHSACQRLGAVSLPHLVAIAISRGIIPAGITATPGRVT